MSKHNTMTVRLCGGAMALLDDMRQSSGLSRREYLERLLHYAGSCYNRPGAWEADRAFRASNYDEGSYADRWFTPEETYDQVAARQQARR